MNIILYIILGIWLIILLCLITAPEGYQDDRGFHYGKQKDQDE
jgi:hypothetical protein